MQRNGPAHYHPGSPHVCHCSYAEMYNNITPAAGPYGHNARPQMAPADPRDYAPAVRRVAKPKPQDRVSKSREMKFDEKTWQWYFETKEAPGVKWLESVWHVADLPQAKDPDFLPMLNEYYLCGHVVDEPDQDRMPVIPGGIKHWPYSRARPPPPLERSHSDPPPVPPKQGYNTWIEPVYHRQPSAPPYASGSAHPVSVRIPSGVPHPDTWRIHSNAPAHTLPQKIHSYQEGYPVQQNLGPIPSRPPRGFVDGSMPHRRYDDRLIGDEPEDASDYADDASASEHYDPTDLARGRAYIPPPSPKSRRKMEKLRERGYRVTDPYENADAQARADAAAQKAHAQASQHHAEQLSADAHGRPGHYTYPSNSTTAFIPPASYHPKNEQKIEIHRLLQTRNLLGIAKIPELVFDLRYDPKHAFDRTAAGGDNNAYWSGGGSGGKGKGAGERDLATSPAFIPGQDFVRLVIRHPFNGKGGDWVEDIDEAKYLTVMDIITIISEMVHKNIDQKLDWDSLSEVDKGFVYEAYLNRPCPDEEATGRRLHLFCDKYMFGGIEQLPAKAKGTTAEGPSFLVKLIRNSKHKRYDRLTGFGVPIGASSNKRRPSRRSYSTYPTLADDSASAW